MPVQEETQNGLAIQQVHEAFTALQAWPHWPEIARGAQKEYGMSSEEFYVVLPEFQRFLALNAGYCGLGMLSEQVDRIWHSLILNTIRYRELCTQYIGRFIEHLPCTSYAFYGVAENSSICTEPPSSCTDPYPAPPDPSPVPKHHGEMYASILAGSSLFVAAYTESFGQTPSAAIWQRVTQIPDAIAG